MDVLNKIIIKLWVNVKSSAFFYPLYLKCIGKYNEAKTPKRGQDFYLAGYQRSGNSFVRNIINSVFENANFCSHAHSVSYVKLALQLDLPVVILIREPSEAISSSVVLYETRGRGISATPIKSLLEYIEFYQYVLDNETKFKILHFDVVKNNPEKVISVISSIYEAQGKNVSYLQNPTEAYRDIKEQTRSRNVRPGESGWYSEEKEKLKDEVKKVISEVPEYGKCLKLYEQIISLPYK